MILACCVGSAHAQETETSGTLPLSELPIVMVGHSGMAAALIDVCIYEDGRVVRMDFDKTSYRADPPLLEVRLNATELARLLNAVGYADFEMLPDRLYERDNTRIADAGTTVIWIRRDDRVKVLCVEALGPSYTKPKTWPIKFARRLWDALDKFDFTNEVQVTPTATVFDVFRRPGPWSNNPATVTWPNSLKPEVIGDGVPAPGRRYYWIPGVLPPDILRASSASPEIPIIFDYSEVSLNHRNAFPGEFELKRLGVDGTTSVTLTKSVEK